MHLNIFQVPIKNCLLNYDSNKQSNYVTKQNSINKKLNVSATSSVSGSNETSSSLDDNNSVSLGVF